MKDKLEVTLDELTSLLEEKKSITKKEFGMAVTLAFLYGMVLGIFFSPKKHVVIGSNNTSACAPEDAVKDKKHKLKKNRNLKKAKKWMF